MFDSRQGDRHAARLAVHRPDLGAHRRLRELRAAIEWHNMSEQHSGGRQGRTGGDDTEGKEACLAALCLSLPISPCLSCGLCGNHPTCMSFGAWNGRTLVDSACGERHRVRH